MRISNGVKLESVWWNNELKTVIIKKERNRMEEYILEIFNSKEELLATCEAYFAQDVIEGIVVKTPDARFSAKIMNNYYDSKK